MSSKQTRRSISVSGELYDVLKAKAEATSDTQSNLVEAAMRELLGMEPRAKKAPTRKASPIVVEPVADGDDRWALGAAVVLEAGRKAMRKTPEPEEEEDDEPAFVSDPDSKASLLRRQIAREAEQRKQMIAEAAKKREEAKKEKPVNTGGGIFTF